MALSPDLGLSLACGVLAALFAQACVALVAALRRSKTDAACRALERQLLQARVDAAKKRVEEVVELSRSWRGWRKFQVVRKVSECEGVASFYLYPHDKKEIPTFHPGQFLTFRLAVPGQERPVIRCYSLSDCPRPNFYRVSIKALPAPTPEARPGLVSNHFHQNVKEGDLLDVQTPSGQFFLDVSSPRPVVLIGAGVGVTPLISMSNALTAEGRLARDVYFFHGARNRRDHVMKGWLTALASQHERFHYVTCYSNPLDVDREGDDGDFQFRGRVTLDVLQRVLPSNNFEFYLCGPGGFMEEMSRSLEMWGVPASDIHFEYFGPSSVKKLAKPETAPVEGGLKVRFDRSGKDAVWEGAQHSLLDFLEAQGVKIDSGCRAGSCNTCITAIKSGEVTYTTRPSTPPAAGSCLVCISVPKTNLVLDV